MAFTYLESIQVHFAAAPVANSPYTLSATAADDVPTATIAGINNEPHVFLGGTDEFYNSTPGKKPTDPWGAVTDVFTMQLKGYPVAFLRTNAAIADGVQVTTAAAGQIGPATVTPTTTRKVVGVTLGAQPTVNGLVAVLVQVVQNPLFLPI